MVELEGDMASGAEEELGEPAVTTDDDEVELLEDAKRVVEELVEVPDPAELAELDKTEAAEESELEEAAGLDPGGTAESEVSNDDEDAEYAEDTGSAGREVEESLEENLELLEDDELVDSAIDSFGTSLGAVDRDDGRPDVEDSAACDVGLEVEVSVSLALESAAL